MLILTKPLLIRKGKLEANRLLQIFLMDYRDLMAWMTDLATRISSGEPAKNVREAEALLELHTERKVLYIRHKLPYKAYGYVVAVVVGVLLMFLLLERFSIDCRK